MKNIILSFVFCLVGALSVQATEQNQESYYPRYCSNFGDKVSFSFTSCVNSNYSQVGFELRGIFLNHCSNFGDNLSYSFQSCVTNNFHKIERELGIFLSYCSNFGDGVSYSYVSCINRNFSEISRELDRQRD